MAESQIAVKRWCRKADNDLRTATTMIAEPDPPTDTVCFHAQQCFEKCLKAFLTAKDINVPRSHDLTRLVTICGEIEPGFLRWMEAARDLTDYAVEARYPDDWREIPLEEAAEALSLARGFREYVLGIL